MIKMNELKAITDYVGEQVACYNEEIEKLQTGGLPGTRENVLRYWGRIEGARAAVEAMGYKVTFAMAGSKVSLDTESGRVYGTIRSVHWSGEAEK